MADVEMIQTSAESMVMLLDLLELAPVCSMCGERFEKDACGGIMPSVKKGGATVVLCKSVLCMSDYFCRKEDAEEEESINSRFAVAGKTGGNSSRRAGSLKTSERGSIPGHSTARSAPQTIKRLS